MKKSLKICIWIVGIFAVLCIALMMICNHLVVNNAKGKAFSEIDSIRYNKVGLLLGTTPQARFDRITNYFFIYRIDAAEQLYKAGKIEKILISGDDNSLDGVNETECMRDSLVARGIPANAIILDGKGYRTISSVINANRGIIDSHGNEVVKPYTYTNIWKFYGEDRPEIVAFTEDGIVGLDRKKTLTVINNNPFER